MFSAEFIQTESNRHVISGLVNACGLMVKVVGKLGYSKTERAALEREAEFYAKALESNTMFINPDYLGYFT